MADKMAEVKPRLRGWLHAGSIPLVAAAGIVLVTLSPSVGTKVGSGVFISAALLLFGISAIYHLGTRQPAIWALLRRLDHSNIFILIAGTYTAFAMVLLDGNARVWLLTGGFHEVFHSFTILAFIVHYVGVFLATYALR